MQQEFGTPGQGGQEGEKIDERIESEAKIYCHVCGAPLGEGTLVVIRGISHWEDTELYPEAEKPCPNSPDGRHLT